MIDHPNGPLGPTLDDEIRKLRELAEATVRENVPPGLQGLEYDQEAHPAAPILDATQGHQVPISEELVARAPEQMPAIVRSMHHTAAGAIEDAAHHLEEEMASCLALMRETAAQLRMQGDSQASNIELLATLIRETHGAFRAQADKLARFRAGATE